MDTLVGALLLQVIANLIKPLDLSNSTWQAVTSGTVLLVIAIAQAYRNGSRRNEAAVA